MTKTVREAFSVTGRVQGVGFRAWAAHRAAELGLTGWVRNRPDGSVHVAVSGGPEAVARYRELLGEGPSYARVDEVASLGVPQEPTGERFEIRG